VQREQQLPKKEKEKRKLKKKEDKRTQCKTRKKQTHFSLSQKLHSLPKKLAEPQPQNTNKQRIKKTKKTSTSLPSLFC